MTIEQFFIDYWWPAAILALILLLSFVVSRGNGTAETLISGFLLFGWALLNNVIGVFTITAVGIGLATITQKAFSSNDENRLLGFFTRMLDTTIIWIVLARPPANPAEGIAYVAAYIIGRAVPGILFG